MGLPLFQAECLKWPGFVEFDDVNCKILTYSAVNKCAAADAADQPERLTPWYGQHDPESGSRSLMIRSTVSSALDPAGHCAIFFA